MISSLIVTAIWVALLGLERDGITGRYPVRLASDPGLRMVAIYLRATARGPVSRLKMGSTDGRLLPIPPRWRLNVSGSGSSLAVALVLLDVS